AIVRQHTVFAIGRVSMMRTVSPARASWSLRAFTFVVRVICFPYLGCAIRRVRRTVTVLSILSLTTTPVRVLRAARPGAVVVVSSLIPSPLATALRAENGLHPGDVAAQRPEPHRVLDALGRGPEAEHQPLVPQFRQL